MSIGDLAVKVSDAPLAAIYFLRGNILISVEKAGEKSASGLKDLAGVLDESLKETLRKE